MALELPNLADKSYRMLLDDALAALPSFTRKWTDFNDSDPGITILQLLAWIDQSLLYRLNRIPDDLIRQFVRLAGGTAAAGVDTTLAELWSDYLEVRIDGQVYRILKDPHALVFIRYLWSVENSTTIDIQEAQRHLIDYVSRNPYRLVTATDIARCAQESTRFINDDQGNPVEDPLLIIPRAVVVTDESCIIVYPLSAIELSQPVQFILPDPSKVPAKATLFANRYLVQAQLPDTLSLILLRDLATEKMRASLYATLTSITSAYLAPRQLLGCPLFVAAPRFTDVDLTVTVVIRAGVNSAPLLQMLASALLLHFDPLIGGSDGNGWKWNQAPDLPTIAALLTRLDDVLSTHILIANYGAFRSFRVGDNHATQLGLASQVHQSSPPFIGLARVVQLSLTCIDEVEAAMSGQKAVMECNNLRI
jgi:hypothetical protein